MRYVLLLLTLLTAGFSVWYYQNRISPEGKELAAQKTTLEQEAAILEKAVIQSRKKLDDAQDATRAAEEDIERFQQAYLQQKRQQHQEIQDSAYQKSVADQQEEVKEHDQKIDRLRRRMKRQRESTKSAREELLRKKEGMRTQLDRLTDQQRSIQAELEQARLDVSTEQAEALKAIKKTYSSVSKSGKESELVLRVPQRRAVNARLNAAEAYVAEAEQALRDTVLEAPYTCQVVECSVGAGARVVAGQPVGKVIPLQERMIRIPVPLEEFSALPRDEQGKVNTALTASCVLNNGKRLQWLEAQEERIRFFDEHGYTGLMPSAYRKLCDACITFYFRCTDNVEEAAALKKELKDRLKAYEQQGAEWIKKLPARTRMGYKLFEICPAIYGKLLSRMQEAG